MMNINTPKMFKNDLVVIIKRNTGEVDDYGKPIEVVETHELKGNNGINYQPLSSRSDMEKYGASSNDVAKAVILKNELAYSLFDEDTIGSSVYLFESRPDRKPKWDTQTVGNTEPTVGYWANYEVDGVLDLLVHKNVYFKKKKRTGTG